ncbi:MAG: class I SAM-dependent methyltransferase [Treponema sp.]|nr:class I SAM-dependent methyltransferase [Treponema sp.]
MNFRQPEKTWSTPVAAEERRPVPCVLCGGSRFKSSLSCEGFSYVKCAGCGLVQINPQPLAADVERRYRQTYGNDYLAYELKNEAAFLDLQKRALADAGFDRIEQELMECTNGPPAVVDIGCATGALLAFLRDRGWRTTGVEISPSAEYARNERRLDVRCQNLEDCRFPPESFDLALASHLVEHLNHPGAFIRQAWQILRPGAYLMLTTPNIDGFQARLLGRRWRSAIFDHLYLFSIRTIKAMLETQGFVTEGVYTWGGLAAGIAPLPLKTFADRTAKALGLGDVMLVKARKSSIRPGGNAIDQRSECRG